MQPLISMPTTTPSANTAQTIEAAEMNRTIATAAPMVNQNRVARVDHRAVNTPKSSEPMVPPMVSMMPAITPWFSVRPDSFSNRGVQEFTK